MQPILWTGTAAALAVAVVSGFAERRRSKRRDLDLAGFMPWSLIQVLAMLAALVCASLALNLR